MKCQTSQLFVSFSRITAIKADANVMFVLVYAHGFEVNATFQRTVSFFFWGGGVFLGIARSIIRDILNCVTLRCSLSLFTTTTILWYVYAWLVLFLASRMRVLNYYIN